MANAFNKPQSSEFMQTYVSQYVQPPMEMYMKGLAMKQDKQDKTNLAVEKVGDALYAMKGVATADNEKLAEVNKAFAETADSLTKKDLTTHDAQGDVKGLIKGISRDPDLLRIRSNRAKYDDFQENYTKMLQSGKEVSQSSLWRAQKELADYEAAGGYKSGKTLSNLQAKEQVNVRPVQEQYFDNIPQSGGDTLAKLGETYYNNGWKGITDSTINSRAMSAYSGYSRTAAAQQEREDYEMLAHQGALPKGPNGKTITKEEYVFKNFLDAGLERVGGVSTSGYASAANAEHKRSKEEKDYSQHFMLTEASPMFTNGRKPKFDAKGNVEGSGNTGFWTSLVNGDLSKWWNDKTPNAEESRDWGNMMLYSKLSGKTHEQAYNEMERMRHIPVQTFKDKKSHDYANEVFFSPSRNAGAYANMQVIDLEKGQKGVNFVEYLRQSAANGKVTNSKGEPLTLSDNPTGQEIQKFMSEAGVQVMGKTKPNYLTADGFALNINGKSVIIDNTYGGEYMTHVSEEAQNDAFKDKVMTFGAQTKEIIEKDPKTKKEVAVPYVFYKGNDGNIHPKKLSEIN